MRVVALVVFLLAVAVAGKVAPLLGAQNAQVIPGSYIVVLKDGFELTDRDAHILTLKDTIATTGADAEIGFVYNIGTLIGFSARLTPDLLKAELAHPDVQYIEADQVMSINYDEAKGERAPYGVITQTGATWGINRVSQRDLPLSGSYIYNDAAGNGVDVYVIDTGILTTHVDFATRAVSVYNAVTAEQPVDLNGHGTHCAGTIAGTVYGVAKQANLKAVKVLSASGSGTTAGVIAGVNYVTNSKTAGRPSVASMSLGGGASATLDTAVQNSIIAGTQYSIAAGNDNANACNYSPARVATAVTVGATTIADARSSFSNIGTCVNIFAPGTSITSDWIGATNAATNTISGTSMAAPHVAGVIAVYLSTSPAASDPASVKAWLNTTATPGKVTGAGTGSPNFLLYSPSS